MSTLELTLIQVGLERRHPSTGTKYEWDTIIIQNCICKTVGKRCVSCTIQPKFLAMDPKNAVKAIYSVNVTGISPFLSKLALATLKDPRYRKAGAADAFIWYIENGRREGVLVHWFFPLIGIINALSAIYRKETGEPCDASIVRTIFSSYSKIIDAIWEDRDYVWGSDNAVEPLRLVVAKFLTLIFSDKKLKKNMYDNRTLALVFRSWAQSSLLKASTPSVVEAAMELLLNHSPNEPPRNYLDKVFDCMQIPTMLTTVHCILENKKLIDHSLLFELQVVMRLVSSVEIHGTQPFVPVFLLEGVHRMAVSTVRRQIMEGKMQGMSEGALLLLGSFLDGIFVASPNHVIDILTDLFENTPFVDVVAAVFRTWATRPVENDAMVSIWARGILIDRVLHGLSCDCTDKSSCAIYRNSTPEFFQAVRAAFARIAIPTLLFIDQRVKTDIDMNPSKSALELFMLTAKISDWVIRDQHRQDKKCCNRVCPTRMAFLKAAKTRTCAVCECMYYCGRECQKTDWSIHKLECRRFKESRLQQKPVTCVILDDGPKPGLTTITFQ